MTFLDQSQALNFSVCASLPSSSTCMHRLLLLFRMTIRTTRAAAAAAISSNTLRPSLSSVFKQSKSRSTTRTLVTKAGIKSEQSQTRTLLKIETLAVSHEIHQSATVKKTVRRRKSASTTSDDTATVVTTTTTTTTTNTVKESKTKAPATNPWEKRPRHTPAYAHAALEHLCSVDPALKPLIARHPYLIDAEHETNYFRVLTRTIIGQQIHWKAARSIIHRFVSFFFPDGQVTVDSLDANDKTFPTPERVLATSIDDLRQCGLSERKASYIQDLARHFAEGKITFTDQAMLKALTDQELASQLLCVRGIGQWTVDMFLMSSLERLDVLPTLDLGVRRGMEKHFSSEYKNGRWGTMEENDEGASPKAKGKGKGKGKKAKAGEMTLDDMERMAERWRPYRSIASWYMWRSADSEDVITAPV